jgi:predicted nicotinamide N-methyase
VPELVPREVAVGARRLPLLIPPDAEALLDEEAFEHEEFLPYWAELWPSGIALAEAVAAEPPRGLVLELGCGLGLPSLVAALAGADVVATDWAPDAIALLERNAARAGATLTARRWSWTEDPAPLGGPFALVLAADVLYERRNAPQVRTALDAVVAPGGQAWIAEPGRPGAADFFRAAEDAWDIRSETPGRVTIHRLRRR